MKTLSKVFLGMCFAVMMTGVQAATVSLSPSVNSAPQGTPNGVMFDLNVDFGSTTILGGELDFSWLPTVISFNSFTFVDPVLSGRTLSYDKQTATTGHLSFGFAADSGFSFTGPTKIGTIKFDVVGTSGSSTSIGMFESVTNPGFYDNISFAHIDNVSYQGATVNVTAAVPLPAAFWLLLSGLSPLGFMLRRKSS